MHNKCGKKNSVLDTQTDSNIMEDTAASVFRVVGFFEVVVHAWTIPRCQWESGILGCDTVNGGAVPSIIKHYSTGPANARNY